jgi:hypothetical protein
MVVRMPACDVNDMQYSRVEADKRRRDLSAADQQAKLPHGHQKE